MKCVSQAGRERLEAAVDGVVRLPNGALLAVECRQFPTAAPAVVAEFLREGLERAGLKKKRKPRPLPRGKDMGRMLVNIADRDRLYGVD